MLQVMVITTCRSALELRRVMYSVDTLHVMLYQGWYESAPYVPPFPKVGLSFKPYRPVRQPGYLPKKRGP